MPPSIIAIDGPAGAGKTVIGLWLADCLRYTFFDTGVLYRASAWLALTNSVAIDDADAIVALIERATIDVDSPQPSDAERGYTVTIDGHAVTDSLFTAEVNASVSPVAAHSAVRAALLPVQRRIGARGSVVMVGRDVGTTVLPDAELKIYLDASIDERARRRWEQEHRRGGTRTIEEVRADVAHRDALDTGRGSSPLRAADDAHRVNTDDLSLDDEKKAILDLVTMSRG